MASRVRYLSTGIMDTAFESQVLPVLVAAHQSQFDLIHISFDPFRREITERYREKWKKLDSMGIKTLYFKQMPPFAPSFLAIDVKRILSAFRVWREENKRVVIHARGHLNAYRGLILKKRFPEQIRLIADLRGAVSDEVCQGPAPFTKYLFSQYLRKFYQRIEHQVVHQADAILCVSNVFKEYLQTTYGVQQITVIPTFVDTSRFKFSQLSREVFRKKLGLSDRIVFVYSGGIAPWQRIENIIQLFIHLRRELDNLFMLFLSPEPSVIEHLVGDQIRREDMQVIRVPHHEVGGYLCAADVGILLREKILTNRVAAPIKFSEYMCCGLPCILSEEIGDTAEVIRKEKAGIVLDGSREAPKSPEFQKLLVLNREEISNRMSKKYASSLYIPEILKLYRTLAEKRPPFSLDAC